MCSSSSLVMGSVWSLGYPTANRPVRCFIPQILLRLTIECAYNIQMECAHEKINSIGVGVFICIFDHRGHVLCVRRNYGRRDWTTPGGKLEAGETPQDAAKRETLEETGFVVDIHNCVGIYFNPSTNDLVLSLIGRIVSEIPWVANGEIAERAFFATDNLPQPLSSQAALRIADARKSFGITVTVC